MEVRENGELVGEKIPMCRITGSTLRTWWTWNVGSEVVVGVMVPVSVGWPPPWAWKIVEGVHRI